MERVIVEVEDLEGLEAAQVEGVPAVERAHSGLVLALLQLERMAVEGLPWAEGVASLEHHERAGV